MLKKKYPNSCLYFGAVGDDSSGEIVKKEMDKVSELTLGGSSDLILCGGRTPNCKMRCSCP